MPCNWRLTETYQAGNRNTSRLGIIYDYIDNGKFDIKHLTNENMIADILTKLLQGKLLKRYREKLLNA